MSELIDLQDCAGGRGMMIRMQAPRANALEPGMLSALEGVIGQVRARAPEFLLLTGGRNYTSGGDVARFLEAAEQGAVADYAGKVVPVLQRIIMSLLTLPCPVIAAARGAITGGGAGLLFAADAAIVAPDAFVQPYYARMGFAPDGGWTALLPERIGAGAAQGWLMADTREDAGGLLRLGLAQEIADDPQAAALARMEEFDPGALAEIKALVWDAPRVNAVKARLEAETEAFRRRIVTPQTHARMQRFLSDAGR
ncbi:MULTISPECIES: enoyl-CoA hydratase/isomerase family protein [Sediminimonas]|uniref:enoyl-CoA hydratase/isomerase family protein n=1 Tax=Sediminimonas TaxID=659427 RepID=UPI00040FEF1C|nr:MULTISPECIES: enoyl-CoA hydratase/isomerase family protein [Sediminimonas]MDR9484088.1 enoyl-CoA hydratase/isomerase family protein [Sediminimonas sp.]